MGAPIEWRSVSRSHSCARSSTNSAGQFSPDGHWIAYVSDESGSDEIYVREFSSGSDQGSWDAAGKWLISKGGGTDPRWRGDGKELFYVASDGKLMSVDISAKPVFEAGAPKPLFQLPLGFIGGDVTADGRRFLIGVPVAQSASVPFTVVMNWQIDLEEISPANIPVVLYRMLCAGELRLVGGDNARANDVHRP